MGEIMAFPGFGQEPDLDGMDRGQLLACLEQYRAQIAALDEAEPEDMASQAYDSWGNQHEALEDLVDEILDRLDEL